MSDSRQLLSDTLLLQGVNKAALSAHAGIQPSALSHWLKGRPSIAADKLTSVLSYVGLKSNADGVHFRDNHELLSPRVWRVEENVMGAAIRLLNKARAQFGEIQIGLPKDIRGAAILFSNDGLWGAVQRCNPILLVGHRENAAHVGNGVIQRILDGDTNALIDSCRLLAEHRQVELHSLDGEIGFRASSDQVGSEDPVATPSFCADLLSQWAKVAADASLGGLDPKTAHQVLNRYLGMKLEEKRRFLSE